MNRNCSTTLGRNSSFMNFMKLFVSGDPQFAALLNRLREGNHTSASIEEIESFANTDTSEWPDGYMEMYMTNHLVAQENEKCLKACDH